MELASRTIDSPAGRLKLVASERGLVAVLWDRDNGEKGERDGPERVPLGATVEDESHAVLLQAERELREYFEGGRTTFTVPLDMRGTSFQKQVWEALLAIPFGETSSYGELARKLGDPKLTRAVGAANGRNPISIIVPCHRVVGASGKLTGFAGGLKVKALLLDLEQQRGFHLT